MLQFQFLAVVLVRLERGSLHCRGIGIRCTEGIVVRHLLHRTAGVQHLAVVTQVVLVVVIERETVAGTHGRALCIASVEEHLVYHAVIHDKAPTKEVVILVCTHDLALRIPFRLHTEPPRDVRHCVIVLCTQLLARGAIGVPDLVAVGEVYPARVVVEVVGYICDAAAPVGDQRAVAVVDVLGAVRPLVLERAREVIVGGSLRHSRQTVAVVGERQLVVDALHEHLCAVSRQHSHGSYAATCRLLPSDGSKDQ